MPRIYLPLLGVAPSSAMDIRVYIELVVQFEKKYKDANDTSRMITRLRKIYYGEEGWDKHLIKGAKSIPGPYKIERKEVGREELEIPYLPNITIVRHQVTPRDDQGNVPALFTAQEVRLRDGSYLDIGHVFAGLDALQYKDTVAGLGTIKISSNVDAVTWVGDLGSVLGEWKFQHIRNGLKSISAEQAQSIINEFSPAQDMLGNIDAYVLHQHVKQGKLVSDILREYYLADNESIQHRYSLFAKSIGLKDWDGNVFSNEKEWVDDYIDEVNDAAAMYVGVSTTSSIGAHLPFAAGLAGNPASSLLVLLLLEAIKARMLHEP